MRNFRRIAAVAAFAGVVLASLLISGRSRTSHNLVSGTVARAADGSCSLASLSGTYAIHAHGTVVGQVPGPFRAPPFPFGEAEIITFDGRGQHSGKTTVNLGVSC